ncbi:MAG: hypothetical protein AB1454_02865 [Candidatus Auribacterota bacterium]
MSKTLDRKEIEKKLPTKSFVRNEQSHHIYFNHYYDGKKTGIYTYISHSPKIKTYSGALLKSMQKQLRLDSLDEVVNLVKCPLTLEQYNNILREKGILNP